jgi:tetratricopeptide (TPR) repeat protein
MKRVLATACGLAAIATSLGCAVSSNTLPRTPFVTPDALTVAALATEGVDHFRAGRYEQARAMLSQAYHIAPESKPLKRNLAVVSTRLGNYERAIELYRELLEEEAEAADLQLEYAQALVGMDEFDAALAALRSALDGAIQKQDDQLSLTAARSLSDLSFKVGLEEDALCYSDMVLAFRPDKAEVARHAKMLVAVGSYAEASKLIEARFPLGVLRQEPRIAHELALAKLGEQKISEFFKFEKLAQEGSEDDRLLQQEIELVTQRVAKEVNVEVDENVHAFQRTLFWPANVL